MFERSEFEKLPILSAFCSALGGEFLGTFCRYKKYRYVKTAAVRGRSPTETFGNDTFLIYLLGFTTGVGRGKIRVGSAGPI